MESIDTVASAMMGLGGLGIITAMAGSYVSSRYLPHLQFDDPRIRAFVYRNLTPRATKKLYARFLRTSREHTDYLATKSAEITGEF